MNINANRKPGTALKQTSLRRCLLPVLVASCFTSAVANPLGPQVVNGQASFLNQGNLLSVTNTPGAIINWQSFSINPGEITRFIQQNPDSAVLNRILGQDPSKILGALQSNGRVFLVNPNGIVFGQGAQVDVNGLVASTLNISNEDFLNGKMLFKAGDKAGNLKNEGAISTPAGGQVFLIAPNVESSGIITSPKGDVMLAAGHTVQLVDTLNPDLRVVLSAPENEALNLGQVIASGGRTGIYGALVKQRGVINADSAVVGENGKVVLKASRDAFLETGSRTSAKGVGKGGEIQVLGERVGLTGDAKVDASGQQGGGTVLVGGDYQGRNPDVPNAKQTYIGNDTEIRADAIDNGDGGKVIVWADETAQAYGRISVHAGYISGNGGFVETSGKRYLDVTQAPDIHAPKGKGGTWLLDPEDITISTTANSNITVTSPFLSTGGSSVLRDATLKAALNAGGTVTVDTTGSGTSNGDITIQSGVDLSVAPTSSAHLFLVAHRDVNINSNISATGTNPLAMNIVADQDNNGTGSINIASSVSLVSNNGNISMYAGSGISLGNTAKVSTGDTTDTGTAVADVSMIVRNSGGSTVLGTGAQVLTNRDATLSTDSITIGSGAVINKTVGAAAGTTKLTAFSSGRKIDLGTKNATMLSLTSAELASISNTDVEIGDTTSGDVAISGNLSFSGNLTVSSGNDITWANLKELDYNGAGDSGKMLTLIGGRHIHFNGKIHDSTPDSDLLTVKFSSANVLGVGAITMSSAAISSNGGSIILGGASNPSSNPAVGDGSYSTGISLSNTQLLAGDGDISIFGRGATGGGKGVQIYGTSAAPSKIETTAGDIRIFGYGGANGTLCCNDGVYLIGDMLNANAVQITSGAGDIDITGVGGSSTSPTSNGYGVAMAYGATVKSTSGWIWITGTGGLAGNGGAGNAGFYAYDSAPVVTAQSGGIEIDGTGQGLSGTNGHHGIALRGGAGIESTGSASIELFGTSMADDNDGYGILVEANSTVGGNSNTGYIGLTADGSRNNTISIAGAIKTSYTAALSGGDIVLLNGASIKGSSVELYADRAGGKSIASAGGTPVTVGDASTDSIEIVADTLNFSASDATFNSNDVIRIVNATNGADLNVDSGFTSASYNAPYMFLGSDDGETWIATDNIVISSPLVRAGSSDTLALIAGGGISQTAPIVASKLAIRAGAVSSSAAVNLNQSNDVDVLAGFMHGNNFVFHNSEALTVGTISYGESILGEGVRSVGGNVSISTGAASDTAKHLSVNAPGIDTCYTTTTCMSSVTLDAKGTLTIPLVKAGSSVTLRAKAGIVDGDFSANNIVSGSGSSISLSYDVVGNIDLDAWGATEVSGSTVTGTKNLRLAATSSPPSGGTTTPPAPTLSECTANPSLSGCSAVLPTLEVCAIAPTTAGCSAVLPTVDTCVANPTQAGCTAVLPTLGTCTAAPTTPGCSAVLPSLNTCTSAPATQGCSAVLPTLDVCMVTPSTPGCGVVLPTVDLCVINPSQAGCSAVLPPLSACVSAPTTLGCSVVLPSLTICTVAPTTEGCSVVLPTTSTCIATPALPGCTAVLPTIATCVTNPTQVGCTVVLPTLTSCTTDPSLPGCSVVLPSMSACTSTPTLTGCTAVLPTLVQCSANPNLDGCSVVVPAASKCVINPAAPECQVVLPVTDTGTGSGTGTGSTPAPTNPVTQTVILTTNTVVATTAQASSSQTQPGGGSSSGGSGKQTEGDNKKEEKKTTSSTNDSGAKKNEPAKKMYCN